VTELRHSCVQVGGTGMCSVWQPVPARVLALRATSVPLGHRTLKQIFAETPLCIAQRCCLNSDAPSVPRSRVLCAFRARQRDWLSALVTTAQVVMMIRCAVDKQFANLARIVWVRSDGVGWLLPRAFVVFTAWVTLYSWRQAIVCWRYLQ
jgi:hypothetical protein